MSSKKYTISNIKQLIDLNGSLVNFQLNFKVVSLTNEPFDAVVMTQEMLDGNPNIEYQKAEGQISGQIKNDNGVYNNYFLILKSDKSMEVELTSELQEIPMAQNPVETSSDIISQPPSQIIKKKKPKESSELSTTWKIIVFAVVFLILAGGWAIWYFYYRTPVLLQQQPSSEIKDGLNFLGSKIEQVTLGVNDNLNKISHNITENLQELKGKIPDNIVSSNDLNDFKNSFNEMKPSYDLLASASPPPPSPSFSAVDNAEEVLAKLNSFKILNKQA